MSVKIIDLSVPLQNYASEPSPPQISYYNHEDGARRLAALAGVEPSDFPDSQAMSNEVVTLTSHAGTHVDAPYHYGSLCEGKPAMRIDEIPLEWCYGPGVLIDVRHKQPGEEITAGDIQKALSKINYTLKEGDIALLWTGVDKYWGSPRYMQMQPGLGLGGVTWLTTHGVKVIGIDAWGLDRSVKKMGEDIRNGADKSVLWPAHLYGKKKEYLQIEKLANLDKLPPYGFTIAAFPVKLSRGSGAWTRAVAILEDKK